MKKLKLILEFTEYVSIDELKPEDRQLIEEAQKSMMNAYAPYSQFRVGAAVLLENGKTVTGNNQENASYPVSLCAERVAIFAAASNYPEVKIKSVAITAYSAQFSISKPVSPCGACRQVIAEYENRYKQSIRVIMAGERGSVLITERISNLLPHQFNADGLIK